MHTSVVFIGGTYAAILMKFNVRIVFCLIDFSSSSSVSRLKQAQSLFSDYTLYFSTAALDCLSCNHANTIDQCHKTPCAADEVSYTFDLKIVCFSEAVKEAIIRNDFEWIPHQRQGRN